MIKQCFALLLTFLPTFLSAQNNLVVLSEKGQKFILFVNDTRINDSAQSQVLSTKIWDDTVTIKMVFADKNEATFGGKIYLLESDRSVSKREFTYSLTEEKGKRKLSFISVNNVHSDTVTKTLDPEVKIKSVFAQEEKRKEEQDKLTETYPPPSLCTQAISDSLLNYKMKLLRDNHIEINRMKDAKWFVSHNCITMNQLSKLMDVFDRQDSKVKIAEFTYDYGIDNKNFLQVLEAVKYPTEKAELKTFYDKRIEK